jgi:hypothetical protein
MFFLNPLLLFGLAAVVIPPVVHFFARRKYDEVAWGAMQFLRLSPKSRRKVLLERLLLMAARMAVLGLLALALAGPTVRSSFLGRFEDRPARTTVVLIDASGSAGHRHDGRTAVDAAKAWAAAFLDRCRPGDRVALFAVRGEVVPLVGAPSADREQVRTALELLPEPRGSADWPAAVEAAARVLDEAGGDGEVLALGDGQRFGWADADALARWDLLARKRAAAGRPLPRVWAANVVPDRPADGPNAGLGPVGANRTVASAGTEVRFSGTIRRTGPPGPLPRVRLEIDGRPAGDVRVTAGAGAAETPFAFGRRFGPGSHLVTLKLDPDALPADDRQDFALDVLASVPVLIVDGGGRPEARSLRSDFFRTALAPTRDPSPAFAVRTVHPEQLGPAVLAQDVAGPGTPPQVLVLADVAGLTAEQDRAIERFLGDGGGVLVLLGDRCVPAAWRDGRVWLPARPAEVGGTEPDSPMVPKPEGTELDHPVSAVFRNRLLTGVVFPRYWKLRPDAGPPASVLCPLSTGDPLFVERPAGSGRVIVSAVPLDNTWETNLVGLPGFVPLAHELCYHLAGTADTPANLSAGEPLVVRLREGEPSGSVTVQPPDAQPAVVPVRGGTAVFTATRDPGVYRATTSAGRVRYFVVRPDPRESDLTAADESDRQRVAQAAGSVEHVGTADELQSRRGRGPVTRDLTGLMLAMVLVLLIAEVWYTRRLAS